MSMNVALNNALGGLTAVGRSAQLVSSNIANALTAGYGRRELDLSSTRPGGVRVDGVQRIVNPAVLSDRRVADAAVADGAQTAGFLDRMQSLFGAPDDPGGLTGRLSTLGGRLIEAAGRPDSGTRLQSAAAAAKDLAVRIGATGTGIQAERQNAEHSIASDVDTLNSTLAEVDRLNSAIVRIGRGSDEAATIEDQRQRLIDRIAEIVPLRQLPRERGAVALMSTGGQILLDSRPAVFAFTRANAVTPGMTLGAGTLSAVTVDGRTLAMNTGSGRLDGGRLAGAFAVRDILAPQAQSDLDAFARDLIERFETTAADPTRLPGDPALFSDGGFVLGATPPPGLAQRLTFNPLADPAQGGDATRLRDGIGAAIPGPVGNAAGLQALSDAMMAPRGTALGVVLSADSYAAELMSRNSGALFRAELSQSFERTRAETLREQELRGGVDTDQEMQKLLLVEQSYGANARVIQAIDDMMRRLLEI